MANYKCTARTNYFHVKDEAKFRELMSRVHGNEGCIDLWQETDNNGNCIFGFGAYGGIAGVFNDAHDEEMYVNEFAYDEFISELQKNVADDDAIIIFEVGNEKLRYLVGSAIVITSKATDYLDLTYMAVQHAGSMLNNDDWQTVCEY